MIWFNKRWTDYREARYRMRTVFWGPVIVGVAILFLFAAIPQSREVYLRIIEDKQFVHGALGLALIILLCSLLYFWQHMLGTAAIDRMYLEHADIHTDQSLLALRDWLCRISAALPLVGLALGLLKLIYEAQQARTRLINALQHFSGGSAFAEFETTTQLLPNLPFYGAATMMLGGLMLVVTLAYARSGRRRALLRRHVVRKLVLWAGAVVALVTILGPLVIPDRVVFLAQLVGPMAGAALALITFVTLVMGVSYLSNRLRLPIVGIGVLLLLVWAAVQTYHALTPAAVMGVSQDQPKRDKEPLLAKFDAWLDARLAADGPAFAPQSYPVFIVAAQGGGIYAASATAQFLASMQDMCPGFAQHVFAISSVSGGAIGAALFVALEADKSLVTRGGCREDADASADSVSAVARQIVRRDHLSPALALLWPDLLRKFTPNPAFDRSSVLERSFSCAFERQAAAVICPEAGAREGSGLRMPFAKHWLPDKPAPALIITATWVETGFRAALAPFQLHAISDGTLYSLPTGDNPGDFAAWGAGIDAPRSLIEAALVSARFPGIVPAWQVTARATEGDRVWNFVDGGYVDNSGASTALELYSALKEHVAKRPVDLYLLLLTDANTDPNVSEVSDGTRFNDTVAPITALLSVRGQLANRAVRRAVDWFQPEAGLDDVTGRRPQSRILVVNLRQRTFELPLGWIISRTTDDIVRLMMGSPKLCDLSPQKAVAPEIADAIAVINDNSCVRKRLKQLLSAGAQ